MHVMVRRGGLVIYETLNETGGAMTQVAEMGGEIRVRLTDVAGRIVAVEIVSTRPVEAARMFEEKTADAMCGAIGRVFSLCGNAQTVAALTAVEQALGIAPDLRVGAAWGALRRAEILTQVVTRLALHWRRVLELPLAPDAVRAAMAFEQAIERRALGEDWRRPGAGTPGGGAEIRAPQIDIAALIGPIAEALAARGYEGYGALPAGMPPERGVLAAYWDAAAVAKTRARHGAGLAARLAAAEAALRALPGDIRADLDAAGPSAPRPRERDSGAGEATVDTARGPLTHRVRIADGVVVGCRTEAPTEVNFADRGPVAAGLAGAASDPVAAELHVLAIDPCVAARVDLAPGRRARKDGGGRAASRPS